MSENYFDPVRNKSGNLPQSGNNSNDLHSGDLYFKQGSDGVDGRNNNQNSSSNAKGNMDVSSGNVPRPPEKKPTQQAEGVILEMKTINEPLQNKTEAVNSRPNSSGIPINVNISNQRPGLKLKTSINFKKIIKWTLIIVVPILLIGGGAWGYSTYEKYAKSVKLESLLPSGFGLIAKASLNPNAEQYKLLEANFQKFPGYETLKKEWDNEKKGLTVTEKILGKLDKYNLTFEQDIKPVIGEKIYFMVPDITEVGKRTSRGLVYLGGKYGRNLLGVADKEIKSQLGINSALPVDGQNSQQGVGQVAGLINSNVSGIIDKQGDPETVGTTIIGQPEGDANFAGNILQAFSLSEKEKEIEPVHFILAAEVKNLTEAKKVIDKLRTNTVLKPVFKDYNGYQYVELTTNRNGDNDDSFQKFFSLKKTYHVLLGKNWIASTKEEYVKDAIDRRISQSTMKNLFSKTNFDSMEKDSDYSKFMQAAEKEEKNSLISIYYKVNTKNLYRQDNCTGDNCYSYDYEMFKLPENLIAGLMIKMKTDGFVFRGVENKYNLGDIKSYPFSEGLAKKMPSKAGDYWGDIFFENSDFKNVYYNFKRNTLSDKSQQEYNEGIAEMENETGINIERDVVDLFSGSIGTVVYTRSGAEPRYVFTADISDEVVLNVTLNKIVESIKKYYAEFKQMEITYSEGVDCRDSKLSEFQKEYYCTPEYKKKIEESKKALVEIQSSKISETESPVGKIYSYKLPGSEFSFDYGFAGNIFVWATHYDAAVAVMGEIKNGTVPKIADSQDFQKVGSNVLESGYAKFFLNTKGLWSMVEYYMGKFGDQYGAPTEEISDEMFAFGAILRTMKLIGNDSAYEEKRLSSSAYINIEELPRVEKERASQIIKEMTEGVGEARTRANKASIKSYISSMAPAAIICEDDGGEILSGNGGDKVCSQEKESETWPTIDACGSNATDTKWKVLNGKSSEWSFSLECSQMIDCNGPENAKCTSEGCTFGGSCQ